MRTVSSSLFPARLRLFAHLAVFTPALFACEQAPTMTVASASKAIHAPAATSSSARSIIPQREKPPRVRATRAPRDNELGRLPRGIGLAPGSTAPDAKVRRADGSQVSLASFYKQGPTLIVFYRGGWCPYCNYQIRQLQRNLVKLKARGVTPIAISADPPTETRKTEVGHKVHFPLLSDPSLMAHRAYKVIDKAAERIANRQSASTSRKHRTRRRRSAVHAVPAIFLVDEHRKILWSHSDTNYKSRPTVEQLLKVLDERMASNKPGAEPSGPPKR